MSSCGWGSIRNKDPVPAGDIPTPLRTVSVASWASLVTAVNNSIPGDHIVLTNGTHANTATTFTNENGTAANPIVIKPQTVGGVTLNGTGALMFSSCSYLQWYGFVHRNAASVSFPIRFQNSHHCRFGRNDVALTGATTSEWFSITSGGGAGVSNTNRVDHNYWHDKSTDGPFLTLGFGVDCPTATLIEYNLFKNYTGPGEPIIWGNSTSSPTNYNTVFQHNLMEDNPTSPDGEMISIKCSNNSIFHNSFINNSNGTITLRHGHFNKLRCNYFSGGGGIVISGSNHTIMRNHFTNMVGTGYLSPIALNNGNTETLPAGPTSALYERVDNCRISLNSVINGSSASGAGIMVLWGRFANANKPTNNIFEGNILYAETGTLFDYQNSATAATNTLQNNIAYGAASVGDLTGHAVADPLVTLGSDGLYRIASGSPARNLVTGGTYDAFIDTDIDGEDTTGVACDAGSDQYSTATVYPFHVIRAADVGPFSP